MATLQITIIEDQNRQWEGETINAIEKYLSGHTTANDELISNGQWEGGTTNGIGKHLD